ncbi:mannose-6-phosphate isomerase, class I [Polaribacter sp.]|uniref:mannose-6-phosphate isomerase, class I n=1 Tax=Polaribacter sp. TaxID=1920175 RepID=UPI004048BDAC
MSVFKIKGVIQNYDWGGRDFIPNLLGVAKDGKSAEYWMGAHDKAPSLITDTNKTLNDLISEQPEVMLGSKVFEHFGKLPFLFKVLDVNDMLSIQVHPSKEEALKEFEKENRLGIPLSANHRNYKDDNHKPEIMVALGDFWLLHGFQSSSLLKRTLSNTKELIHLLPIFEDYGYQGLYQKVMEETPEQTNSTLQPLIDRVLPLYKANKLQKSSPDFWAARAHQTFSKNGIIDKGIYSIYFFNIVNAQYGEAVFQDAGVPHAYLEGQCIELMANSDNVLRGGLTPKHVDVPELMKHVKFVETIPKLLKGDLQSDGYERIYKTEIQDFELSKIDLNASSTFKTQSKTFEILLLIEGNIEINNQIQLNKGEVVAISANYNYNIEAKEKATLYRAKSPQ